MPDHLANPVEVMLRVFADRQVIKLLAVICDEPLPLHTMARIARMSEVEAMKHIAVLRASGLVRQTFATDGFRWQYQPSTLYEALAALKQDAKPAIGGEWTAEEAKVLGDFFVGGRLKTIPAQRKKKDIVVRYLAEQFDFGRTYTEQEVNFNLLNYHEDYASLRREMVDTGLMRRENGIYQRLPAGKKRDGTD